MLQSSSYSAPTSGVGVGFVRLNSTHFTWEYISLNATGFTAGQTYLRLHYSLSSLNN